MTLGCQGKAYQLHAMEARLSFSLAHLIRLHLGEAVEL